MQVFCYGTSLPGSRPVITKALLMFGWRLWWWWLWLWWRSTCFALGALSKLSPLTFTDYAFCVQSTHFGLTLNWTLQHNWTFSTGRRLSCGQCPRVFPSQCRCPGFTSPRFPTPSQFRCRSTFGNASNLDPTAPRIRCNLKGLKLSKILLLIKGAIWQRSSLK